MSDVVKSVTADERCGFGDNMSFRVHGTFDEGWRGKRRQDIDLLGYDSRASTTPTMVSTATEDDNVA